MKSAREFRSRAVSFKVTAVAITRDSLIAESAYREFMHRNPTLLTNQKLKEQQEIRAREAELHQHRMFYKKLQCGLFVPQVHEIHFVLTYQAPL